MKAAKKSSFAYRLLSFVLALTINFSGTYVYAESVDDNVADVIFGSNVVKKNVSEVAMGIVNSPNVTERDGVEAWGMYPAQWKNSAYLLVDLDDKFAIRFQTEVYLKYR